MRRAARSVGRRAGRAAAVERAAGVADRQCGLAVRCDERSRALREACTECAFGEMRAPRTALIPQPSRGPHERRFVVRAPCRRDRHTAASPTIDRPAAVARSSATTSSIGGATYASIRRM
ncbi:hypothetical protein Y023_5717 [Burkholderia pseudomallei A79D]|nr:hypothetical protein Y023_5717 [Burkholderia pseudomallei A79D]